jgi:hypothetical protein
MKKQSAFYWSFQYNMLEKYGFKTQSLTFFTIFISDKKCMIRMSREYIRDLSSLMQFNLLLSKDFMYEGKTFLLQYLHV